MNQRTELLDQMLQITTDLFFETESNLLLNGLPAVPTSILDIGCGNGVYLSKMNDRYPAAKCTGIELDQKMYSRADLRNDHRMRLVQGSYEQLDGQDTFDLAIARLVILHIPDIDDFVNWLCKRLHHRSRVVIIDFDDTRFQGHEHLPLFISLYKNARQSLRRRRSFLDLPDILKLEFQHGGLAHIETKKYGIRADSPSKKYALYAYMKLSTEYLLGMPLSEDRADELNNWLRDPDSDIEIPMFGMSFGQTATHASSAKEAIFS